MFKTKIPYLLLIFLMILCGKSKAYHTLLSDTTFTLVYQDELDTILSFKTEVTKHLFDEKIVEVTTGFFRNGQKDSVWRLRVNKDNRKIGFYKDGMRNGEFRRYYYAPIKTTNTIYHFKNDTLDGQHVVLREDLSVFYIMEYEMGKPLRVKMFDLKQRPWLDQSFKDGVLHGSSTTPYKRKYLSKTEFIEGKVAGDAYIYDKYDRKLRMKFVLSEDKTRFVRKIIYKKNGKVKSRKIRRKPCIIWCKIYLDYYFPHQKGYSIDI